MGLNVQAHNATPSTPSAGFSTSYPKTDNLWYYIDPSGNERLLLASTNVAIAANRVPYASATAGIFTSSANLIFDGTTLTAHTLTVSTGTVTITGGSLVTGAVSSALFNTVATTLAIGGAATTLNLGAATGTATIANAATVVSGTLTVSGAGNSSFVGNVGIGTTSPNQKLKVQGSVTGATGVNIWTQNDDSTGIASLGTLNDISNSYNQFITFGSAYAGTRKGVTAAGLNEFSSKGNLWLGTESNHIVYLGTNSIVRCVIDTAGNVGIGTAAQLAKLAINGGLHVGGDSDPGDNNALIDGTLTVSGVSAVGGATLSTTTALITPAGATGVSSLRIPHGSAPTTPVDGDMWSTTTTLNFRLNGVTKSITMT